LKKTDNSELVNIGRIGSAVGLKGEVRVILYAQDSDNLKEGKVLLLKHVQNKRSITAECKGVRFQKGNPVIKLDGIEDRNNAELLRGMELYIKAEDLEELPEGEHYVRDLIGYEVVDIAGAGSDAGTGTCIGTLNDVIQNTAQSILDVRTPDGKQVLIPAVDAFMRGIDDENGMIKVELIQGFI
jgi:16S rRNA processing protein RimM